MTEKMVRWPTVSVITPIDTITLVARTPSITSGLTTWRNASTSTASVSTAATRVAMPLSRNAFVISSADSAGPPVTPAETSGNSTRSSAILRRISSMASRSAANPPPLSGSAKTKRRRLSSERNRPSSRSRPSPQNPAHGE